MIDYHLHTKLCKHAKGEIFEYIESAISKGLKEIAFTDHIPLPENFDIQHRMTISEIDYYIESINEAKRRYPEITIRLGIEADYYEGFEEFIYNFLNNYDFDLVIMSVHFIKQWPEANWVFDYNFAERSNLDIYKEYINTMINGIQTGLFDIIGHADLIKQPGNSLITLLPEQIEKMLKEAKNMGMALEINTSGYRRKIQESYPGFEWLPTIKEIDIPITIGSDAHDPSQIAMEFNKVYQALNFHEINKVAFFDQRKIVLANSTLNPL